MNNMFQDFLATIKKLLREKLFIRKTPGFWQKRGVVTSVIPDILIPFSVFYYGLCYFRNRKIIPEKLSIPVICAGNLTVGGAGKTPLALKIAAEIKKSCKKRIAFISRGYMGDNPGPVKVDLAMHKAEQVGDETLLLAKAADTYIAKDRLLAAKAAIAGGAEIIIMDDGFQNPSIKKDLSFIAVDGGFGIGNGLVLPAGPLREPLLKGLKKTSAIIFIGYDKNDELPFISRYARIIKAKIIPQKSPAFPDLLGKKVIAFAGIGRPGKFFETLLEMGAVIIDKISFPDHYMYQPDEIAELIERAEKLECLLITTEKDHVRLPQNLAAKILALKIELEIPEPQLFAQLIKPYL